MVEDVTRGQGAHLVGVLELAGCDDANAQTLVIPLVRADIAAALSAPGYITKSAYIEKVHAMYKSVNTHAEMACSIG